MGSKSNLAPLKQVILTVGPKPETVMNDASEKRVRLKASLDLKHGEVRIDEEKEAMSSCDRRDQFKEYTFKHHIQENSWSICRLSFNLFSRILWSYLVHYLINIQLLQM